MRTLRAREKLGDITSNLVGAEFLNVGDVVQSPDNGQGEVLGFSANGDPFVLFDSGKEDTVDLSNETLIKKHSSFRPGQSVRPDHVIKVQFSKRAEFGFVKVFGDWYELSGTKKTALMAWEWDSPGYWKVEADENGKLFLVKSALDENDPGDPTDITKANEDNTGSTKSITSPFHIEK